VVLLGFELKRSRRFLDGLGVIVLIGNMKIILSRKGFDSVSGGCPSPILTDKRMVSLPIPDKWSPIRYKDISWQEYNLGTLVSDLTGGRVASSHSAHLDVFIR